MVNSRAVRRRALAGLDREGRPRGSRSEGTGRASRHLPAARLADQSRQRYWGAPIPIVHCPERGEVAVPDDQLPVLLPDDVDFRPGGESPLARHPTFVKHVPARSAAATAKRDTDTMDTFVDSSLVLLPLLLAGLRGRAVPPRGRRAVDAGRPVHRRGRARDPAPALLPLLHEGALRHGDGRVHRAVPAADEPGPGDLRRRVDEQVEGQHRRADAARRALGRRLDAPDHAVRRPVRGRHRLEADRRRDPETGARA